MSLVLAFRAFFRTLFHRPTADEVRRLLEGGRRQTAIPSQAPSPAAPLARQPSRSDAVTLLATLQREARFVDLVKESLDQYSDAQVGAAARDVLRDCGQVLDRCFALGPLVTESEGATIETPAAVDSGKYRLLGHVHGSAPYRGKLVHHGWQAQKCHLPQWTGSKEAELVVAPVELEVS